MPSLPDSHGHFGEFGGKYVAETLMPALAELEKAYKEARRDPAFKRELEDRSREFVGRPTPLYHAANLTRAAKRREIYLKREDLCHTGAHKVNNALGQALLAVRMGKTRITAETGAGQHGVAAATMAALFQRECEVFMGSVDVERQALNVFRMKLLGTKVTAVDAGSKSLKDALNEALRDWIATVRNTYYLIGTAAGPHPYPMIVRDFQSVIGREARRQIMQRKIASPTCWSHASTAAPMRSGFSIRLSRTPRSRWLASRRPVSGSILPHMRRPSTPAVWAYYMATKPTCCRMSLGRFARRTRSRRALIIRESDQNSRI